MRQSDERRTSNKDSMTFHFPICSLTNVTCLFDRSLISSVGSCYTQGEGVACNVTESSCTAPSSWYPPGFVSNYGGCCHCQGDCDHTQETSTNCTYYDYPSSTSRRLSFVEAMDSMKQGEVDEVAYNIQHYANKNKASREADDANRRLSGGSCSYTEVCCMNPSTDECVLMGHPPQGHKDVVLDHCPTSEEGTSGLFSYMVDESETPGRYGDCCGTIAAPVEWSYTDGSSTGADEDGNTGCQKNGTCEYKNVCCYNTWKDHKCYLWEGLPFVDGYGGTRVACPLAQVEGGYVYQQDESDGRNNHCCEEQIDSTPHTFRGAAVDGNLCWLTEPTTTTLADGTLYTGKWIGFMAGDTSDDVLLFTTVTEAEIAGCHIGDWDEKSVNQSDGAATKSGVGALAITAIVVGAFSSM